MFAHIGRVSVVAGFLVFLALMLVGASAGYTAESPDELEFSDDIDFSDSYDTDAMVADPITKWQMNQIEENDMIRTALTENIVKPLTYGGINYVAEPMAQFTYNNQWIPLAFWKVLGYLGVLVPIGYAGHETWRFASNV